MNRDKNENEEYFSRPQFRNLLQKYEHGLQEQGSVYMEADDLTDIAEYYLSINKEREAMRAIRIATELHPNSTDPKIFMARQEMFNGNLDKANEIYDTIIDRNDREVVFLKAELLIRENNLFEAMDVMMDYVELLDEDADLFFHDCVQIFEDYGLPKQAEYISYVYSVKFPDLPDALYTRAAALYNIGEYDEALPLLTKLLDNDAYNLDAWKLQANIQLVQNNFPEATESAEYGLAIEPDDTDLQTILGQCRLLTGQAEEACRIFKGIADALGDETSGQVTLMYSMALTTLGSLDEAESMLVKALENPYMDDYDRCHSLQHLATICSKKGMVDEAIGYMDKAEEMDEGKKPIVYAVLKGRIMLENHRLDEGKSYMTQAFNQHKDKYMTGMAIATAYADSKYYSEALDMMKKVESLEGNDEEQDAQMYALLAFLHYMQKEGPETLATLKKALSYKDSYATDAFQNTFPNVPKEDLYDYVFHDIYGRFPKEGE